MNACDADNVFEFKSSGDYVVREGASKCDASSEEIIETAHWSLSEFNTRIKLKYQNGDSVLYEVLFMSVAGLDLISKGKQGADSVTWITKFQPN